MNEVVRSAFSLGELFDTVDWICERRDARYLSILRSKKTKSTMPKKASKKKQVTPEHLMQFGFAYAPPLVIGAAVSNKIFERIRFSWTGRGAFINDAMKRATPKTRSGKRKAAAKKEMDRSPALKERLEAEFAETVKSATFYIEEPQRLRALFQEAAKQAASLPRDPFKETWPYFQTMLRLIRAYYRGEYRDVTESAFVVIVAAIIYVVNPLDLIPDAIPAL